MPVFVIILNRRQEMVVPRIEKFPEADRYRIKGDVWLVNYLGTSRSLAENIGIRGSSRGGPTGVVFPILDYSGRASPDLWDWLKLRTAAVDL